MPRNSVYSCSMPNHVSKDAKRPAMSAFERRMFDGCGCPLTSMTSHNTSRSSPPRIGSGQVDTGWRTQSERSPVACCVLDPSTAQIGGFSPVGTIFVLERSFCVGWVPSIQMYSARYTPMLHYLTVAVLGTRICISEGLWEVSRRAWRRSVAVAVRKGCGKVLAGGIRLRRLDASVRHVGPLLFHA